MEKGIGGHQRAFQGRTDDWLTPPEIINSLGVFDLDPCASLDRPWDTAIKHYTIVDDGLNQPWEGRVWLNPPYGPQTGMWLKKMAVHNYGMALIFARTETKMFHDYVWKKASALFFFEGRLYFYDSNGIRAKNNAGGPSVLIAYGLKDAEILKNFHIKEGIFIKLE
jgi:hypothetical protein